ncbi:hypothetical protein ACXR0O_23820 [Verrucomicrobiota bacterium sgz303538]
MASYYDRKAELITELDRARSRASANRREMQGSGARAAHKAEASVSRNRYKWVFVALLAGFVIAKLPARTKKVVVNRKGKAVPPQQAGLENAGKAGIALAVLKILLDITKPVIMAWATKRLGEAVNVGKDVRRKVEKVDRKV